MSNGRTKKILKKAERDYEYLSKTSDPYLKKQIQKSQI